MADLGQVLGSGGVQKLTPAEEPAGAPSMQQVDKGFLGLVLAVVP